MAEDLTLFREFPVTVYGNLEKYNEVISKSRCRIFYKYENRNGTYITDEFAEQLLSTIAYTPVKGIYDFDDYTDHGSSRSLGRIYGIVPENPNFAWETHLDEDGIERIYACVDVLIFTALYEEASEIVGKSQSMEIYEKSIDGEWQFINGKKYFVFTKGCFLGLQVLGEEVEPCFEGAAFFTLNDSIDELIKKIERYNLNFQNNRQGGNKMPSINFKLSDGQKHEMLWSLLNPNYNEEGNWSVEYGICDIYDGYAVVKNYAENRFERIYYNKNDDSLSIEKSEVCYIVDVTESEKNALDTLQKLNNGNYEKIDEVYTNATSALETQKSDFEHKIEELETSVSTLTTEKAEAEANYEEANNLLIEAKNSLEEAQGSLASLQAEKEEAQNSLASLQAEKEELEAYKAKIEKSEKEAVLASYNEMLSEEIIESYTAKINEYDAVQLDKELAYELKKTNPSVFSKNPQPQFVPKDDPKGGLEEILSKYVK